MLQRWRPLYPPPTQNMSVREGGIALFQCFVQEVPDFSSHNSLPTQLQHSSDTQACYVAAVERAPQNMTVREGDMALFQCLVPEADVTMWRKDGDMVTQGPRKRVCVGCCPSLCCVGCPSSPVEDMSSTTPPTVGFTHLIPH